MSRGQALRRPRWRAQHDRAPAGALESRQSIQSLDFQIQFCRNPRKKRCLKNFVSHPIDRGRPLNFRWNLRGAADSILLPEQADPADHNASLGGELALREDRNAERVQIE